MRSGAPPVNDPSPLEIRRREDSDQLPKHNFKASAWGGGIAPWGNRAREAFL